MVRVEERPFRLCRTQHVFGSDPCCSVSAFHIIKPVYDCTLTTALPRFNIPVYKHTHKKILSDAHNMSTMSIHNAMVVLIREHTPIIIVPVKGVNSWNHWLIGFSPRAVNVFIFQVFNSTIRARRGRWWIWKRWKNVKLSGRKPAKRSNDKGRRNNHSNQHNVLQERHYFLHWENRKSCGEICKRKTAGTHTSPPCLILDNISTHKHFSKNVQVQTN